MVMFHAGSLPCMQGWHSRGESRAVQNVLGSRLRTRQQVSTAGFSQLKKSSIHDAVGCEIKDTSERLRSASKTLATDKSSQVVNRPQRLC